MKRMTAFTAILILASLATVAQADFSGNWIYKDQQSISGNLYSNGSPKQIGITQTGKTLIIKKTSAAGDGTDYTTADTMTFDGTPFKSITLSKRYKETTFSWNENKDAFTTVGTAFNTVEKSKADFKTTDTWTIENDQLVLTRKSENFTNGEVWVSKAVYDKQ